MRRKQAVVFGLSVLAAGSAIAADPATIDWNAVPAAKLTLFYPGQSSYEWLTSPAHKSASKEVMRGDACTSCHDDETEEKTQGAKILRGNHPLEPVALKKAGSVDVDVRAAYDDRNAYLRFQWKSASAKGGGIDYPAYRFDGKEWKSYGAQRLLPDAASGKTPPIYEDRLSLLIDDGKVPGFAKQGCWLTCHEGERTMPNEAKKDEVAANPMLSALKKGDVRKYLPATRTNPADWRTGKSVEEIQALKSAGQFLDLIQWRAHRTNPLGAVDDGYVLEWRNFDAGKNHFASNMSPEKQPRYMYDAAKLGAKALTAADFGRKEAFLIKGRNAVPFDPNAGWKEGDILPQYYLQPDDATGSAADNKGKGEWKDGVWTVVIVRPLGLTNPDDKALKPGQVYNVGIAVHDDNVTTRGHYVSYVRTLGLGTKADIQAVKLP